MRTLYFRRLYIRELEKLKLEIGLYKNEKNIWIIDKEIANSSGNLCLHIVGNLNHFIGHVLGKTDYVRNRENEFSLKFIPIKDIIAEIDLTIAMVDNTLKNITDEQLADEYPIAKFEEKASIEFLLTYLLIHLSYHLGQINYHRRLLD